MRSFLPVAIAAIVAGCGPSSPPSGVHADALMVNLDRSGIEVLDGPARSWIFDVTLTNARADTMDLRYFVHGETPTGDVAHRGIFPAAARRVLSERVMRMDFGTQIQGNLLAAGAVLRIPPGESRTEEGGLLLRSDQRVGYSDVVLIVYDTNGRKVGEYALSPR